MANSYVRILFHCVWSTKNRQPLISRSWETALWKYLAGTAKRNAIHPIEIGGYTNHIHALVEPGKNVPVPRVLEIMKGGSSRWINETGKSAFQFRWQDGYGAFTVSPSQMTKVQRYIRNQGEHHRTISFEEEYRRLLNSHDIHFDERYVDG